MSTAGLKSALQYIENTGGGATVEHFIDDFAPIGGDLWRRVVSAGFARSIGGKLFLTEAGEIELANKIEENKNAR